MKKLLFILITVAMLATSCSENYSNGERIGLITQFSKSGLIYKTYEGHLNLTQTGMNSSQPFDFSVDRDNQDETIIKQLEEAATNGWKVKLTYHETMGWNWFRNRGETNHFITKMEVLDKNMSHIFDSKREVGRVIDTIYVVIKPK